MSGLTFPLAFRGGSSYNPAAVAVTGGTITGVTIDNSVIGSITPAAGTFINIVATGTMFSASSAGVGVSAGQLHSGNSSFFTVATPTVTNRISAFDYFANDANGPILVLGKSRGATIGTITYPQAGDLLGTLQLAGAYESNARFDSGADMRGVAGTTWTSTNRETYLSFRTIGPASISIVESARLTSTGLKTMIASSVAGSLIALTDGAGVSLGTLGTAPAAGNPTKWIGIDDNGTIRYVPSW